MTGFRHVTMTEAHRSWHRLINEVVDTDTPVPLTRYGKPVAVLAPYRWYQRMAETVQTGEADTADGVPE